MDPDCRLVLSLTDGAGTPNAVHLPVGEDEAVPLDCIAMWKAAGRSTQSAKAAMSRSIDQWWCRDPCWDPCG